MAPSSNDKDKKSKWRSMLGGRRDAKEDDTSHLRPGPGPNPRDSAYGSERTTSEQPSPRPQSSEPSETNVKQDPSTGNIVTTTVTTTTTTTTVTTNKGEHIKTESTPTVEADATARVRNPDGSTSTPAPPNTKPGSEHITQVDSRHLEKPGTNTPNQSANFKNPAELDAPVPGAAMGGGGAEGPPIPTKSNMRISREMHMQTPRPISEITEPPVSPITPSQHNFSYPARTPPYQSQQSLQDPQAYQGQQSYLDQQPQQGQQSYQDQQPYPGQYAHRGQPPCHEEQPYQGQHPYQHRPTDPGSTTNGDGTNRQSQRPGTFENLKAAAAGIHGAGEILRGTLNSQMDRRSGHAHEQVIEAGRSEIQTGRFYDRDGVTHKGKGILAAISRKPVGDNGTA